jgi:hypothetical protein
MAVETFIQLFFQGIGELGQADQVSIGGLEAAMPLIIRTLIV